MTTRANRSRGMPRHRSAPIAAPSRAPMLLAGGVIALIAVAARGRERTAAAAM